MNSTRLRNEEMAAAKSRSGEAMERRKRIARRAYEGGEMTVAEIACHAHAAPDTVKRWISEGGWKRGGA